MGWASLGQEAPGRGAATRAKGTTDAQHGERLAVVVMAAATNRLAELLRLPIAPAHEGEV